ncbi:MAG: DEAD/DEAH box helicase [Fimbriimonadaceae bacterium]|nr:DEAD/DEAH box helicase [Fimbriimonadaceae bacterium]
MKKGRDGKGQGPGGFRGKSSSTGRSGARGSGGGFSSAGKPKFGPAKGRKFERAMPRDPQVTPPTPESNEVRPPREPANEFTPPKTARKPKYGAEGPTHDKPAREKPARKPKPEFAEIPTETPAVAAEPEPMPTFAELGLKEEIVRAIRDMGYESPTPIQARAIPVLLRGGDLIGQAQTGTGKTAAFALPIIERVIPELREIQALILAPTRELAVQVAGGIWDLAKHTGIRVVPVYGGQPIDRQFRALSQGAHVIVGTPGRVMDHLRRGSIKPDYISMAVLDEADEMMALGFTEDMDAILGQLPEHRQLAFFSATMPPKVADLTKKYLRDPQRVSIEAKRRTVDNTQQTYYEVPRGKKLDALARVLDMESPGPTIVFCRTRQETNDLCDHLRLRGYGAESLHGDMNQNERDRVMRRFRDGQFDLLVATDVAARGLDIETVTHVINYDIPFDVEAYIHRIGRTGRAGRTGTAITLIEGKQRRQLEVIERVTGAKIKPARIPTAADIAARRREAFKESLREAIDEGGFDAHLAIVDDLADEFDASVIAAAALNLLWQAQHAKAKIEEEPVADYEQPELGMARIFVGLGRQDNLRPGDLVAAIANEAGLSGKAIGVIDVLDRTSYVEVPQDRADQVVAALRQTKLRGRKAKVQLARPGARD